MDGYELIRRMRCGSSGHAPDHRRHRASAMPGDVELCLAAGASDYLAKPVAYRPSAARCSKNGYDHETATPSRQTRGDRGRSAAARCCASATATTSAVTAAPRCCAGCRQLAEDLLGAGSLVDLLPALLRDEETARRWRSTMLSVPVSEFFRDPPVWKYLREQVMPELDSFPRINVWQVGCGYGQESYSLAILLHECGLAYKARMITTDINADLLRVARRGRWPADQFAQWRANYLAAGGSACFDDYFVGNDHAGNETMAIRAETPCKRWNSSNTIWSPMMPSWKRSC
jgi:hypothetical protein